MNNSSDAKWGALNKRLSNSVRSYQLGEASSIFFELSEHLRKEKDFKRSLVFMLANLAFMVNGASNAGKSIDEAAGTVHFFGSIFDPDSPVAEIPNGLKSKVCKLIDKSELKEVEVKEIFEVSVTQFLHPQMPLSSDQIWALIRKAIF